VDTFGDVVSSVFDVVKDVTTNIIDTASKAVRAVADFFKPQKQDVSKSPVTSGPPMSVYPEPDPTTGLRPHPENIQSVSHFRDSVSQVKSVFDKASLTNKWVRIAIEGGQYFLDNFNDPDVLTAIRINSNLEKARNVSKGIGKYFLNVAGAAFKGFQIGTGIDEIHQGNHLAGISDMVEGGTNLGFTIAGATRSGAAALDSIGPLPALAVGTALGGSVSLLADSIRTSGNLESSEVLISQDYYSSRSMRRIGSDIGYLMSQTPLARVTGTAWEAYRQHAVEKYGGNDGVFGEEEARAMCATFSVGQSPVGHIWF
jgi:hypothetical protein